MGSRVLVGLSDMPGWNRCSSSPAGACTWLDLRRPPLHGEYAEVWGALRGLEKNVEAVLCISGHYTWCAEELDIEGS